MHNAAMTMIGYLSDLYYQGLHYADRLSPQHWVLLLAFMLFVGVMCLRGFGSRSNY
jgi:hypothetical protein